MVILHSYVSLPEGNDMYPKWCHQGWPLENPALEDHMAMDQESMDLTSVLGSFFVGFDSPHDANHMDNMRKGLK